MAEPVSEALEYPDKCVACGTPVRVEGHTTKSYVSAYESLKESLILAKKQRDGFEVKLKLAVEALETLLKWAEKNHEMPNYSEVIANARDALKQIRGE